MTDGLDSLTDDWQFGINDPHPGLDEFLDHLERETGVVIDHAKVREILDGKRK